MQYHASLLTADGAYHCPVGSKWPFLLQQLLAKTQSNILTIIAAETVLKVEIEYAAVLDFQEKTVDYAGGRHKVTS